MARINKGPSKIATKKTMGNSSRTTVVKTDSIRKLLGNTAKESVTTFFKPLTGVFK